MIYPRVSTEDQLDGYSIQNQLEKCRQYAQAKGWVVVGEYVESYTGKEYIRPEMSRMKEDIASGMGDVVVFYDVDRASRNLLYFLQLEKDLTDMGVEVYYAKVDYARSPEGDLLKHVQASIAQYERSKILERMSSGKAGRIRAGFPMVGPHVSYGYKYVSGHKQGQLVVVEEEAKVVRQIFDWYAVEHLSLAEIARRLTAMGLTTRGVGIKTKHSSHYWGRSTVWTMLKNPVYKGQYVWNGVVVPVPDIVSEEVWNDAQKVLEHNKIHSPRNTKFEYLMRGRLKCTHCGGSFYCHEQRGAGALTGYYRCAGQMKRMQKDGGAPVCHRSIRQKELDELVWHHVAAAMRDPASYCPQAPKDAQNTAIEQAIAQAHQTIDELNGQYGKLLDLYAVGGINQDALALRLAEKQAQIDDEKERLGKLTRRMEAQRVSDARRQAVVNYCQGVRDRLDTLTFAERRMALEFLEVTATITRGETPDDDHVHIVVHTLV